MSPLHPPCDFQHWAQFQGADAGEIQHHVAEAQEWFLQQRATGQGFSFWSEDLRPAELPRSASDQFLLGDLDDQVIAKTVRYVGERRRSLAGDQTVSSRTAWPKRLFVFETDMTLSCGAANSVSPIFNTDNLPAWETWILYHPPSRQLLCYLPAEFIAEADKAICYILEACVFWVDPRKLFPKRRGS